MNSLPPSHAPANADPNPPEEDRLDSWKEIAAFLKKDVRTVQRWEKSNGLPVHRYSQDKTGSVYSYKSEIAVWMRSAGGLSSTVDPVEKNDELGPDDRSDDDERKSTNTHTSPGGWSNRRGLMAIGLACALLVSGYFAYQRIFPTHQHHIKLMVRTLQYLSPGGAQDAFSQGMTDELITRLGRSSPEKLGVLARTTADLYSKKTITELRGLGLDYVIEGSVFQDRDRVRINTQLIETEDGTQVFAKSYEGESKNVLELQAAAADDLARSMKLPLKSREQPREVNPQAYDAYMRGRYTWNQRGQNSVANSITYFNQAIALDPKYAPAYAGLADAYALLASAQYGILPPVQGFGEAKGYAQRSIELDSNLAAPHASLGYISLVFDRNPEEARHQFEKALELDPNYVTAHQWFGQYYEVVGKIDNAIAEIKLAIQQEPASVPVNVALTEAYYFARRYDQAIDQGRSTIQLEPTSALGHFNLGRTYEMKGLNDQAIAEFKLAREYAPNIATLVPLAFGYARAGDLAMSTNYLNQLTDAAEKEKKFVPAIYFAMVYVGRNDKEAALTWLEKADRERCDYIVFLTQDPMVDFLRGDPRFEAIVRSHP